MISESVSPEALEAVFLMFTALETDLRIDGFSGGIWINIQGVAGPNHVELWFLKKYEAQQQMAEQQLQDRCDYIAR